MRPKKPTNHSTSEYDILQISKAAFHQWLQDPAYSDRLAQIKTHFFNREYLKIFENPDLLATYAVAYSPMRALCFYSLFDKLADHAVSILMDEKETDAGDMSKF